MDDINEILIITKNGNKRMTIKEALHLFHHSSKERLSASKIQRYIKSNVPYRTKLNQEIYFDEVL